MNSNYWVACLSGATFVTLHLFDLVTPVSVVKKRFYVPRKDIFFLPI